MATCAIGLHPLPAQPDLQSPIAYEHLLIGRIWDPSRGVFTTRRTVEQEAARADLVLLGERHGSIDHHLLQACLLQAMIDAGRRPAVVFEMIPEDRQAALDQHLSSHPLDAAGIGAAVQWDPSVWPPWLLYQRVADVALAAGLSLRAGNLSSAKLRSIRENGLAALDDAYRARLGLDRPLPEETAAAMRRELFETHRGLVQESAMARLLAVQRARDAILADTLVRTLELDAVDGALLITGTGHARVDRGVPIYLSRLAPEKRVLTIALIEVQDDLITPEGYADRFDHSLPFSFVWFTRRSNPPQPLRRTQAPCR